MLAPSPEKVVIHQLNGRDEDRLSLHAQADAQSDDIWEDILETAASAENSPFVGMAVTSPGPEGPWCMIWRTPKGLPGIMMCLIALAPRN